MNYFVLTAVLVIWLAAVSFLMPLSTLIATRPIGFAIVLAMFGLAGLVVFFANRNEERLGRTEDTTDQPDVVPLAKDAMAGVGEA
jgi:hypothetical protein